MHAMSTAKKCDGRESAFLQILAPFEEGLRSALAIDPWTPPYCTSEPDKPKQRDA
jgi:hypothetical protein